MHCTYCHSEKKMTREHIIPDCFIKGMNIKEQIRWTRAAPVRVVGSDFVIRDVCSVCNGGELSKLDNYCLNLIKKFNSKIDKSTKKAVFKFDFDKLTRWLLKVSFNSSRAAKNEYAVKLYEKYIDYIMGRKYNEHFISVHMAFLGLGYDGVEDSFHHLNKDSDIFIDHFRINQMSIKDFHTHYAVSKQIMINSFSFIITVYDDVNYEYVSELEDKIQSMSYKYTKLDSTGRVKLTKDNDIFIDSLMTSSALQKTFPQKNQIERAKFVIIDIEKSELENMDFSRIRQYLFDVMVDTDSVINNYQKLILTISGYNDDCRELFEIESFRKYVEYIVETYPEIIWFMNVDVELGFIVQYFLGYCYSSRNGEEVMLDSEKNLLFTTSSFAAVNKLTNNYVIDNSLNRDFTEKLTNSLKSLFKV